MTDQAQDACGIDDPASSPFSTCIRLAWFLFEHLLQRILAAQPHASLVYSVELVEVGNIDFVCSLVEPLSCLDCDAYNDR